MESKKSYIAPVLVQHGKVIARTEGAGRYPPFDDDATFSMM